MTSRKPMLSVVPVIAADGTKKNVIRCIEYGRVYLEYFDTYQDARDKCAELLGAVKLMTVEEIERWLAGKDFAWGGRP